MASYKDIIFRFIPESTGGTFNFDYLSNKFDTQDRGLDHIQYIGTSGCYTCVGVYFKIDDSRSFCAHVNGWDDIAFPKNLVSEFDGIKVKAEVLARLCKHATDNSWDANHKEFARDLIVVCPHPTFDSFDDIVYKRTGWFVIEGLREFFSITATKLDRNKGHFLKGVASSLTAKESYQGFIVDQKTGKVNMLKAFDQPTHRWVLPEDIGQFKAIDEPGLKSSLKSEWFINFGSCNDSSREHALAVEQRNSDLIRNDLASKSGRRR